MRYWVSGVNWKTIVYCTLFPQNQTSNTDNTCSQLDRVKAAINEKRPELASREKCRLPSHLKTHQTLICTHWLGCPTTPVIITWPLHFLRSLQNSLNSKTFNSVEAFKTDLDQFITQKKYHVLWGWNHEFTSCCSIILCINI